MDLELIRIKLDWTNTNFAEYMKKRSIILEAFQRCKVYQCGNTIIYIVCPLEISLLWEVNLKSLYCHKKHSGWSSILRKHYTSNNCRKIYVSKPTHKWWYITTNLVTVKKWLLLHIENSLKKKYLCLGLSV